MIRRADLIFFLTGVVVVGLAVHDYVILHCSRGGDEHMYSMFTPVPGCVGETGTSQDPDDIFDEVESPPKPTKKPKPSGDARVASKDHKHAQLVQLIEEANKSVKTEYDAEREDRKELVRLSTSALSPEYA